MFFSELACWLCHYVLWKNISSYFITSHGWFVFFRCPKSFCAGICDHIITLTIHTITLKHIQKQISTLPHTLLAAIFIHDDHGPHDRCSSYNNFSRLQNVIRKQSPRCCQGEASFGECFEAVKKQQRINP